MSRDDQENTNRAIDAARDAAQTGANLLASKDASAVAFGLIAVASAIRELARKQ